MATVDRSRLPLAVSPKLDAQGPNR